MFEHWPFQVRDFTCWLLGQDTPLTDGSTGHDRVSEFYQRPTEQYYDIRVIFLISADDQLCRKSFHSQT